jgi:adenylate cyclase
VHVRELDLIQVKGKKEPTQIYELIGIEGEGEDLLSADFVASWNEGLALYRKKDFKKAASLFEACLKARPKDGPAALYRDRCVEFQKNPPPADWNGVHVMTSK